MSPEDRIKLDRATYVVWTDYGLDGWQPTPYFALADAVKHTSYGSATFLTKVVKLKIEEVT